ncbi:DHB13 dehydrogenase, partial [Halcyon senegalensis]|nr:DHB13 dehydrogenase [Halcyon senegalensis]
MKPLVELLLFSATLIYSYLEALARLLVPAKRKAVSGELVLITGAGHGVGRATALEFAKRRSSLVLWDVNKHGVEDTAAECERLGASARAFVVDCSKREEIYSAAEKVGQKGHLPGLPRPCSLRAPPCFSLLCPQSHAALLRPQPSNAARSPFVPPKEPVSSKFAAVGFHKALTEELSTLGKDGIKTTCLCPVFINTGFVKNPRTRLVKVLEVEEVVAALMEGILTNQKMVFVPSNQRFGLLLERLLPERALAFLNKLTDVKFDAVVGQGSTQ